MSDLREQLRKAGLVSDKELRQAKHRERTHASEVGRAGIEAERRKAEEQQKAEIEARRKDDRKRQEERKRAEREAAAARRLQQVIQTGSIREATIGSRRFFFETRTGRITYLDLNEVAARRVSTGSAAIVETIGAVRGEFCVVTDRAAAEITQLRPELIRTWNRSAARGGGP